VKDPARIARSRPRNGFGRKATVAVGVEAVEAEIGEVEPVASALGGPSNTIGTSFTSNAETDAVSTTW
jgi:hypothetical protein